MQRSAKGAWRRAIAGLAVAWALGAMPAWAQAPSWESGLRDSAPERYTVASGDTLWDIAGRFLRHPWQWPEVWRGNPQIDDPHRIYPGDVITLRDCNGRPCLGLERGQNVVRLSPEVRRIPPREAIAPIPLESVQHFLRDHRVIDDPDALAALAYVVAGDDRRLLSGVGDRLYARGALTPGARYGVYRVGERYRDAASDEVLGLELESVGRVRAVRQEGEIAVLEVVASHRELRDDDIVLPLESRAIEREFVPRAPDAEVDGRILAVPGGVRFVGRLQVVALDRGRRDGLAAGHVLRVEQRGERVVDPRTDERLTLPGNEAGLVMVFRPYAKMSYALVMRASRSLEVGDRVRTPTSAAALVQQ
ncbi:LysM domain-containing protein [Billgrantia azerbaijanica]|nr:LysM domain-containing protein [Halomonas azerbaijanica]